MVYCCSGDDALILEYAPSLVDVAGGVGVAGRSVVLVTLAASVLLGALVAFVVLVLVALVVSFPFVTAISCPWLLQERNPIVLLSRMYPPVKPLDKIGRHR